ncbi:Protein of unknown function [Gryllus bimaculatus]|nr:Protein of unknown function [Gryllus bimaculatus]
MVSHLYREVDPPLGSATRKRSALASPAPCFSQRGPYAPASCGLRFRRVDSSAQQQQNFFKNTNSYKHYSVAICPEASAPGQECVECHSYSCGNCGAVVASPDTKKAEWMCNMCMKRTKMGPMGWRPGQQPPTQGQVPGQPSQQSAPGSPQQNLPCHDITVFHSVHSNFT